MLYAIVPSYALTDFLFEELRQSDHVTVIEHPLPTRSMRRTLYRAVEVYLLPGLRRSLFFDDDYLQQLSRITPDDSVLFFAIENRKDLQIIRKFINTRKLHQWIWNPVRNYRKHLLSRMFYRYWLRRTGITSYSFDPQDAQDFGFRTLPQVYRHIDTSPTVPLLHDVYFLGIDKGRLNELRQWQQRLQRDGLSTHFHIVADKRKTYSAEEQRWVTPRWLPYADNLALVAQSRCILELLQSTQSGPTLRSLEAAFLNKKLITNNRSLKDSPLYSPDRVFIIGEDEPAELKSFLNRPAAPVDPAVLQAHDIDHWIKQFDR